MRRLCTFMITALAACSPGREPIDTRAPNDFATRYTAAWCSHDAASIAAFFAENGSLTINAGQPAVGRAAIAASAQGFMTAFPDLVVRMNSLEVAGERIIQLKAGRTR